MQKEIQRIEESRAFVKTLIDELATKEVLTEKEFTRVERLSGWYENYNRMLGLIHELQSKGTNDVD